MTKELYVEDAHNVVLYLKKRFNKEKIIIVGHSFGSQLALWLIEKYHEDVECYIGVGQFIDSIKNEDITFKFTLDEAIKRGDKNAVKKLNKIGPPVNGVYKQNKVMVQRAYLHKYGGANWLHPQNYIFEIIGEIPLMLKEYTLYELLFKYIKGIGYSLNSPMAQGRDNFIESFKSTEVPVYLFLGHHDYNCSFALAEQWFNHLEAPYKKLVWFENSAHSPQWEEPELWNKNFAELVLKKELHDEINR